MFTIVWTLESIVVDDIQCSRVYCLCQEWKETQQSNVLVHDWGINQWLRDLLSLSQVAGVKPHPGITSDTHSWYNSPGHMLHENFMNFFLYKILYFVVLPFVLYFQICIWGSRKNDVNSKWYLWRIQLANQVLNQLDIYR